MPQDLRSKVLKQLLNLWMIGLALKQQDVYDNRKKNVPTIDEKTIIPLFGVIFGSLDVLIWIKAKIGKKDFVSYKIQEFLNFF